MLKTLSLAAAALTMTAGAIVPVTPAAAQRYYGDRYDRVYRGDRGYYRDDYRSYRMRQKCNDGDGGTIVGAIAGGLLGRGIAGRGDHVLGTVLGAGAGALAGRAIDRSDRPGYCRR
jgi:uncharacterized protein YcfJ